MARRMIAALLLMLGGALLFAPAGTTAPAYACEPTQPLPDYTPPPPKPASSPTPTPSARDWLYEYALHSDIVVVGTIRQVAGPLLLIDVERHRRTSSISATLTVTTYRDQAVQQPIADCFRDWELAWQRTVAPVVPATAQGSRAVFFIETYHAGKGEIAVGRNGAILLIEGDQLRDIETDTSFGPVSQLDTLMIMETRMEPRADERSVPAPRGGPGMWIFITAGMAAAGLTLFALGLILKRIKQTRT